MPEDKGTLLDELRAKRDEHLAKDVELIAARQKVRGEFEARTDHSDEDRAAHDAAEDAYVATLDKRDKELKTYEQRIDEQKRIEKQRKAAARAAVPSPVYVNDPFTYREDNARQTSYFHDLAYTDARIAGALGGSATEAMERLHRHAKETESWLPKRQAERDRRAQKQLDEAERSFTGSFTHGVQKRGLDSSPFEKRVNPNRTDGQGGYFVPPLWLVDGYIPALRAGRVAAGLCRQMDLPEGTDSINIPKLATPTLTAPQSADNLGVASQDFTDTAVSAAVRTLAGQEDVAIQLIEQSPGQIVDRVIMEDIIADYNRLVDRAVLFGTGPQPTAGLVGSGQVVGLYPSANWTANAVTWTSNPTLGGAFHAVQAAMVSKIAYNRYNLQNVHLLMHPRRWFWYASSMDGASGTSGRPLVESSGFGPFNVAEIEQGNVPFEGLAGSLPFGPNVYIDGNVPTTDNGSGVLSGTFDVGVAAKWDDLWLFEGNLRTRVLPEILSGTLEIRYQVYNYVAFLARYGQSITLAQGAGFAAPVSPFGAEITF